MQVSLLIIFTENQILSVGRRSERDLEKLTTHVEKVMSNVGCFNCLCSFFMVNQN